MSKKIVSALLLLGVVFLIPSLASASYSSNYINCPRPLMSNGFSCVRQPVQAPQPVYNNYPSYPVYQNPAYQNPSFQGLANPYAGFANYCINGYPAYPTPPISCGSGVVYPQRGNTYNNPYSSANGYGYNPEF